MRFSSVLILVAAVILINISPITAATIPGQDFPFARIQVTTIPLDNPFPGLGNNYSTLSLGIETAMWNPASVAKTKSISSNFSLISELAPGTFTQTYEASDKTQNIKINGQELLQVGLFFTADPTVTTAATRENFAHGSVSTKSTGANFKQALRINDWLTLGFIARGESGLSIDMSGIDPTTTVVSANFLNKTFNLSNQLSISFNNQGFPTLTVTPEGGGGTYTKTLDQKAWSGFLQQRSLVPSNAILESRNDMTINSDLTMVGAANWKDFCFGLSLTPISATANIDNISRAVINAGTPDIVLYQPNVDPKNESSILNWAQDPNQYATENGYKRNTIRVPAGESIAEARFQGFYSASAVRIDLGTNYDLGDYLTLGLALENITSAALNFKGSGRVAYVKTRVSTAEPTGFTDPTQPFNWSPFMDNFETVKDTENYFLEEEIDREIPKKIRLGVALKKPLLIAVDYEQNQTPIKFKYEDKNKQQQLASISNLAFLRIGGETRIFALPWWLRGSIKLIFKPSLDNGDPQWQDNLNKAFKFGVLPIDLNLGTEVNLWGTSLGTSLNINGSSLISLAQMDTLNLDLNKLVYYDIYFAREAWKVSYLASVDPFLTAAANKDRQNDKGFDLSMLKWVQTLSVGYRF